LLAATTGAPGIHTRSNLDIGKYSFLDDDFLKEEKEFFMHTKRRSLVAFYLTLTLSLALAGCGSSGTSCNDDCTTQGEQRCSNSNNGYEVCGNYDSDNCLEWGGLVDCTGGDTCSNGTCGSTQTGLVLTGELSPAGGVMSAGSMQLSGILSKDFAREESKSGAMTLEHVGFTSKRQGD
jgi:hypothetical protein